MPKRNKNLENFKKTLVIVDFCVNSIFYQVFPFQLI